MSKSWLLLAPGCWLALSSSSNPRTPPSQVGIECGIGIGTKTGAEYARRGENFGKELDFVAANIIMAVIADFMLVWLPAPTYAPMRASMAPTTQSAVARYLASVPDNAFQKVPYGSDPFTIGQRTVAILK